MAPAEIDNQLLAEPHRDLETALAALSLCDSAHDRVQRDVARHAGPISNVSDGARPECKCEVPYRNHLCNRRHLWRSHRWPSIATIRAPALHHPGGDLRLGSDSPLGFLAQFV